VARGRRGNQALWDGDPSIETSEIWLCTALVNVEQSTPISASEPTSPRSPSLLHVVTILFTRTE